MPYAETKPVVASPVLGIALKVGSTLVFTGMAAIIRYLGQKGYPTGQLVFCRSFFALFPLFAMLAWRGQLAHAYRTQSVGGQIVRGVIGTSGMFLGFTTLSLIPLPDATALSFTAPLLTVVLAALLLGEVVRIYRWSAVAIGFVGVVTMLWPHLGSMAAVFSAGAMGKIALGWTLGLVAALCNAFSTIQVRRLTSTESTSAIVFYFSSLCALAGLCTLPFGWVMPTATEAMLLLLAGILGGIGQLSLTESYRHADAAVIAPFDYTSMIWALIIGYMLFADVPDAYVLIGAVTVTAAGLFVIWRERQLGLERTRARQAATPIGPSPAG